MKHSELYRNVIADFGEKGRRWFESLSQLQEVLCRRHKLTKFSPLEGLSYNYVATAFCNGTSVIIKICCDKDEAAAEFEALSLYKESGVCAQVICYDTAYNTLILEKIVPGITLKPFFPQRDGESVSIVSDLLRSLHSMPVPVRHNLCSLRSILQPVFNANTTLLSSEQTLFIGRCAEHLLATTKTEVVLHGDLHHGNVLQRENGSYCVIDPKGWIGDPGADVGTFLRNPYPNLYRHQQHNALVLRRLELFSTYLGYDYERLVQWCLVMVALSLYWSENNPAEYRASKQTLLSFLYQKVQEKSGHLFDRN